MSLSKAAIGLTLLPHLGGLLGGLITRNQVKQWYENLDRPSWRPPNWAFGPVWTTLYTMMGYSSYLVYRDGLGQSRDRALALYASQLLLNWLWTPIFFSYHKLGLASAEITLLLANIGLCIGAFYPINRTAAYLLIPYLGWVSLATSLTYSIWQRNKNKRNI
jgi:benzodiazapine receptor